MEVFDVAHFKMDALILDLLVHECTSSAPLSMPECMMFSVCGLDTCLLGWVVLIFLAWFAQTLFYHLADTTAVKWNYGF